MTYQELAGRICYPDDPAQQERYVQTFEFNPACTLEIGWHLFGENYERGEFLVRMREQLRRHGIAETADLPDHLGHILLLIDRMDREEAAELAGQFVLPALAKIRSALQDNPYEALIIAIEEKLAADFPGAPSRPVQLPIFQEAFID
ncbi:MAG TPA: molecular chaperone TorD family protein [Candidatus Sulfopaludibacter sp.]|nr:molecular chaperone TorD family protein [Candidatus Sulfopaludibacter sp.]